jgi:hypothetical protein
MRTDQLRKTLQELRAPDEERAQEQSWRIIQAAFAEREPLSRRRPMLRPALALVILAAVGAALASPPGRAVLNSMRKAVGVERSKPALFSLPARGRLLATSPAGLWVVADDGSKRRLGTFDEASWSPFGHFVVASRANELVALTPDGTIRWKLARPNVRFPRWGGTLTDTRIAYLTGSRLHVVAGDGTGDVDAGGLPAAAAVAPAWQPGPGHVLAYATTRGRVYLYDPDAGSLRWRSAPYPHPHKLLWSADGKRLLLVTRDKLVLFAAARPQSIAVRSARGVIDAAFAPRGTQVALLRRNALLLLDTSRLRSPYERAFAAAGRFQTIDWSPDGRWLVIAWPDVDQWVFVSAAGRHRLEAVSNISRQFEGGFPTLGGWCCATRP